MTATERYNIIKKTCESKNPKSEHGETPTSDKDLQDEFKRFDTTLETLSPQQDSRLWQKSFFQDLVFGS
jgi:hypothetical protein|tara:strand:+ start:23 stop:229 length:207 start_codon:yes stop_codon:yes gene_type:complete